MGGHMSKAQSLIRISVAYALAFGAGGIWFFHGPSTGRPWADGLVADLIATLIVFVASRMHRNSSFYDAYWSVLPPLLMLAWWADSGTPSTQPRALLVAFVILIWAVRLTGNWIYAFPGLHHEDWRYPMLRNRAGRAEALMDLFAIHLMPTLQVFLGMLPPYVVLTHNSRPLGWLDLVAAIVGLGGVALSFVADRQMYRFAHSRQPGHAMDRGLWGWSRHPNYFGEFSFWLALAFFGLAAAPDTWWWIFAGVIAMLLMFQFASIPMMEQRSLERRPSYQDVINRVPRFLPRPPRVRRPL
jgi:steroid 5-alpha reductase family enzyme